MNREAKHVLELIIAPTLPIIGMDSESARRLMVLTGEVETGYDNLRQVLESGNYGAGYGWWSMQDNAYRDNVRWLNNRPLIRSRILSACFVDILPNIDAMIWNVRFALCLARVQYWKEKEPLPKPDDIEGLGRYWLKYYNRGGKGTIERFMSVANALGMA